MITVRKLLFADFFEKETTLGLIFKQLENADSWLMACQCKLLCGLIYEFFVLFKVRDSVLAKANVLETDDVETQWQKMMQRSYLIEVTHALVTSSEGQNRKTISLAYKIELYAHVFMKISATIEEARQVLQAEVNRYNNHQVHSTTKEIPAVRFEKAHFFGS
jgi:hypothetical protein